MKLKVRCKYDKHLEMTVGVYVQVCVGVQKQSHAESVELVS